MAAPPFEVSVPWADARLFASLRRTIARDEGKVKEVLSRNPLESLVALIFGGAGIFYAAERGRNEKVTTFWDAVEYVATCASVGYSNIFPTTPVGRMVASVLFVLGPSLAGKALDRPSPRREEGPAMSPAQEALLAKLDEILAELERTRRAAEAPAGDR